MVGDTPHQTTIESTESKRCGLLQTSANSIEKPVATPFGRGRSSRFFAVIGGRKGCSTSSAFRGQFNSRTGNRTRVHRSVGSCQWAAISICCVSARFCVCSAGCRAVLHRLLRACPATCAPTNSLRPPKIDITQTSPTWATEPVYLSM